MSEQIFVDPKLTILAYFVAPYVPCFDNKKLWLFATQLRAINADLRYNSQLSLFDISITEKLESLDYF